MTDVLDYLRSKGKAPKSVHGREARFLCWFHDERQGKRGRLYVHVESGSDLDGIYICHVCGERGNLRSLYRYFGDPPPGGEADRSDVCYRVMEAATSYFQAKLAERPDAVAYLLEKRGFTAETVQNFRFGWADGGCYQHLSKTFTAEDLASVPLFPGRKDFFRDEVTIPYLVNGSAVQIRGKRLDGKYRTAPGDKARLFNGTAAFFESDQVAICEGEFDAVLATQMGVVAVGTPGAKAWQDNWNEYVTDVRRLYVVFDNDTPGREAAAALKERFGAKVRVVTVPPRDPDSGDLEDRNDLTDWVVEQGHTDADFAALLSSAAGGLLVSAADALVEWEAVQGIEGLQFGFRTLDKLLRPGFLPGQVVVPLAKSGFGKTALLTNVFDRMLDLQPETKILFLSLEQTKAEWFDRALKIRTFYDLSTTPSDLIRYYDNRLLLADKNRISEDDLLNILDDFEDRIGTKPDLVAIDYLGYWARSYKGEEYQRLSDSVMALKAIAKERRVVIVAPHQVNRGVQYGQQFHADSARGSGVVEETADFVFTMWNPDQGNEKEGNGAEDKKRGVLHYQIAKSRHGGTGTTMKMLWAPYSLVMLDEHDHEHARLQEIELAKSKDTTGRTWAEFVAWRRKEQAGDASYEVF